MFKILPADRDAYIQNRVVGGVSTVSGNTGDAASLDLFKLYGLTFSGSIPNIELSRLLIHFDLDPIRTLMSSSKIDITHSSFNAKLKLFDVFAGQPTPRNFTVVAHPLSRSFDEGLGRDVVQYSDIDVCNFLSGSRTQGPWILSGAGVGGANGNQVDYLTTCIIDNVTKSLASSQLFETGEEDLLIDVTTAISATLVNAIPDQGFRIALTASLEDDTHSYFVKRFASRHAFNTTKHPQLIFKFDDAVHDDSSNLRLDTSSSLVIYNYDSSGLTNIVSASTTITGTNCLILQLRTPISGGFTTLAFTGSQVKIGNLNVPGAYSASVYISSQNSAASAHLTQSGSVEFTPIWGSLDGTLGYVTGSALTFYPVLRGSTYQATKRYIVTTMGIPDELTSADYVTARVNVFDKSSPMIKLLKLPVELPGLALRDIHFQIRDVDTNDVVIPFDVTFNSTKCSSDANGAFFALDASNLTIGRSYVVDVLITTNGSSQTYNSTSPNFKVVL